jgi:RHS repeat-associated protein
MRKRSSGAFSRRTPEHTCEGREPSSPSSVASHISRPVFATNASGVKVWTATYTPFGGVHTSTGALPTARFPGQWFQSESGLHQNWMRDYDPTTGRYLQADPLGLVDGASVYGYVKQNPGRWIDPRGEFVWAIPVAVTGAMMLYAYLVWDYCQDHPIVLNGPFWPDWFNSEASGDDPDSSDGSSPPAGPGDLKSGQGIDPTDPNTWPTPPGTAPETNEVVDPERKKNRDRGEKLIKDQDGNLWRPH